MWTAILLVVMINGQIYTDKARMDEVGLENTKASCEAYIAAAKDHFDVVAAQDPNVDHYRLACIQENE